MRVNRLKWLGYFLMKEETEAIIVVKGIFLKEKEEEEDQNRGWGI